jgi:HPt (histidine-containing phosphotransfer) domain-containing protein
MPEHAKPAPFSPLSGAAAFDRPHLLRQAMGDANLAEEVLGLFLGQLPQLLLSVEEAGTAREWALATHALKGSAASIGAPRLQALAAELEALPFPGDVNVRRLRLLTVRTAAAEFRAEARGETRPAKG